MLKLTKAIALVALFSAVSSAHADFVVASTYDGVNYTPGANFVGYYNPPADLTATAAELVTVGGTGSIDLTSLTVPLALDDSTLNPSLFNLMLVGDSGSNSPDVSNVIWDANSNGGLGALSTTDANYTFDLTSTSLNAGQNYWLVLEQTVPLGASPSGGNGIEWYFTTTYTGADSTGTQTRFSSGGLPATVSDAWTVTSAPSNGYALAFTLSGVQAVPEPGQVAMTGLLLVGAAVYYLRRKLAEAPAAVVMS